MSFLSAFILIDFCFEHVRSCELPFLYESGETLEDSPKQVKTKGRWQAAKQFCPCTSPEKFQMDIKQDIQIIDPITSCNSYESDSRHSNVLFSLPKPHIWLRAFMFDLRCLYIYINRALNGLRSGEITVAALVNGPYAAAPDHRSVLEAMLHHMTAFPSS